MNHSNLPSKLKDIKNQVFLNNCYDPINKKYVKKVWAHKLTKLGREKRDLIWEYYKYRKRWSVTFRMKQSYQKNVKAVTLIYFDDPVQHRFEMTQDHMNIMKAYDRAVKHDISLKITRKVENEAKTGYRWDMLTKDQFNSLPLIDKFIKDHVPEPKLAIQTIVPTIVPTINEDPFKTNTDSDPDEEDDVEENDIDNEEHPDDKLNDDMDEPIDSEENGENVKKSFIDFNDAGMQLSNDGITRSITDIVRDFMVPITNEFHLKNYKLVNINDHIWLNLTLKAKDGKIIFLKKLRVIKELTKELLDKGFTLGDGSLVHLFWTDPVRNKKKKRNVHKNEQPDHSKTTKKQRRKAKRATRAKKGHIHIKKLFQKN